MVDVGTPGTLADNGRSPGSRAKDLVRDLARGVPRVARGIALSPCTWLVTAAFILYVAFAYHRYAQYNVGACDLGIFYQAVHGWAFQGWPFVPIKGYAQIGDHFSPMFLLLAPLMWIDDSPMTIIAAQALLLCLSAIPVYVVAKRTYGVVAASLLAAAYLMCLGIQNSVAFPVHEVMFTAPLIAWAIERALAGRWTAASIIIGSAVFAKEDMGVLVVAFAIWALFRGRRRHAAALALWGVVMFLLAVKVIIPAVNPSGYTYAADYLPTLHSTNTVSQITYILGHPIQVLTDLFNDPMKRQTWIMLLAPVGFLSLASPIALLALPTMVMRMLDGRNTLWSWHEYYDMPLMPIVFIAAVDGYGRVSRLVRMTPLPRLARLLDVRRLNLRWDLGRLSRWNPGPERIGAVVLAAAAVIGILHLTKARNMPIYSYLKGQDNYATAAFRTDVRQALKLIPSGAEVRATNNLVVPLLSRDTVTLIGSRVDRGNWAVLDTTQPGCPLADATQVPPIVNELANRGFVPVAEYGPILVMYDPNPAMSTVGT